MAQGTLGFQYEVDSAPSGLTLLGGLPLYLDLIQTSGLADAVRKHVRVSGDQGWLDLQMIISLLMLNLAGGDGVADLDRLEDDAGFAAVLREAERGLLSRSERRQLKTRWRKPRQRVLPPAFAGAGSERDGRLAGAVS